MKLKTIERLLATTVLAGCVMASAPAMAQTTTPDATQEDTATTGGDAEIVVTGSRIARPNAESPSPVTTIGVQDVKEFGATKIEDLTNSLPQVFAGQSSGVSNGADGTATIDLRGLGPSRTLVLIDGRRLMPGNVGGGAGADLNFIPAALISSIDLLTGGASATYGADAVAGVVNFKMNREFRGVRLDAQYGFYQHDNSNKYIRDIVNRRFTAPEGNTAVGGAYDATLAIGTGFAEDRGSVVAYAGYRSESPITQDQYDYSICTTNADATFGLACGGSGTPENPRFGGFSTANRTLAGLPAASSYTLTSANTLRGFVTSDQYNFGPLNYFRRNSDRYTAGAFAQYEISPAIKPYLDAMFMDYSTKAQIAPSGAFYGPRTVNCDNPLLLQNTTLATAACGTNVGVAGTTTSILIGKRNTEGGARFNDIGFNQFRIVTGVRGDLNDAVSYDVYYQFGQIKLANTYRNDVSDARIDNALDVVSVGGVATCRSVVNGTDPSCVPYNVFNAGGITQQAANYINIPLVLTGTTREQVLNGVIQADLGKYGFNSPFSDDGVRIALGAEYRKEFLATQPDAAYIAGDGAGQGGPTLPIAGQYTVKDVFGEAGVPLITERPFFHDLSLQLGYRHSSYDVQGATRQNKADTYKIAGTWSPVRDLTLRGSYNRAVRSPNIGELFANQQVQLFSGSDPCAGPAVNGLVNGNTAAQCARTGVTAAQFGNITENTANQYNQFTGGNPNLLPEKADTFSAGVVLNPQGFLSGLLLSADYYRVKVNQAVGTVGAQVVLDQCIATGQAAFCSAINRAPASAGPAAGSLWLDESGFVNNLTTNTGSLKTSGIDVNGDYRATIGETRLRWQFVGTWLNELVSQPLTNGFTYDCAGYYGITCGNPNPEYRFNTNVKITAANNIGVTLRWRYLSPVKLDLLSPDTDIAGNPGAARKNDSRIGAYNYFDLLFSLPIKDNATFRIGVNNVFDRDPPIISQSSLGGFGNGNTFPGTYDTLGRYIFMNLTADF